jgi:hypothetical protein
MRKLLVVLGLVATAALFTPRPAAADFALSIGLPGFGLFIHDPLPPPVVYAPPPVYYRPYAYRPYPVAPVHYRGGWGHRSHHHVRHFRGCGHRWHPRHGWR